MSVYNQDFYAGGVVASEYSARQLLPLITEVFHPTSMLDVGCGTGVWLKTAQSLGVNEIQGVDGPWAEKNLQIPKTSFRATDLAGPFDLGRKFDLSSSVEVAEHVDGSVAETFVRNMTNHSDLVVFGAAVPHQGGTHHVNEKWPDYWQALFKAQGYRCFDILRWQLWDKAGMAPWYKQNTFVYLNEQRHDLIEKAVAAESEALKSAAKLSLVHPDLWDIKMNASDHSIKDDLAIIRGAVKRIGKSAKKRMGL